MRVNRRVLVLGGLLAGWGGMRAGRAAEPHLTITTGTVISFGQQSSLLSVNTRLGPKVFLVVPQTVVLLNERPSTTASLVAGAEVELEYRFDTSEVFIVRITRETRQRGRVVSVTNNGLVFRLERGGQLNLTTDSQTELRLGGILLDNREALVGRRGSAIFQSGGQLLLRFAGEASEFRGRVVSVDELTSTLEVSGRRNRTFTVSPAATVRLNDGITTLGALEPGDRVHVAFNRSGGVLQAAAVEAVR